MTKVVNVYIAYDLDIWLKSYENFKLKKCLFGLTNIVKNSHKGKWMYVGYVIALIVQVSRIFVMTLLGML